MGRLRLACAAPADQAESINEHAAVLPRSTEDMMCDPERAVAPLRRRKKKKKTAGAIGISFGPPKNTGRLQARASLDSGQHEGRKTMNPPEYSQNRLTIYGLNLRGPC